MSGQETGRKPTENLIACHVDTGTYALDNEKSEQKYQTLSTQTLAEQLNEDYTTLCIDEAKHFIQKHPGKTAKEIALIENLLETIQNEQ
tara:strand:+ start:48 stop:314 length:267 start_codon:yes stop_codon:yes gene_type:complete